jgi:hypothetical protein
VAVVIPPAPPTEENVEQGSAKKAAVSGFLATAKSVPQSGETESARDCQSSIGVRIILRKKLSKQLLKNKT